LIWKLRCGTAEDTPIMPAPANLPWLLWTALDGLERAYEREGAGAGQMPSLDLWANLLRALQCMGTDVLDLPRILRLSKRATRSRVLSATRHGWVEKIKSGQSHATVQLTVLGSHVAIRWKSLQDAAEEHWRAAAGVQRSGKLRASLENVVTRLPLEHPHYPASYGVADARITGGNGQDWKAVLREGGDTVSHLPFSALISQLLVAFAMNYEERSPVAFSLSTEIIKRIPPGGRPLQDLGYSVGLAALNRHGFVRVSRSRRGEFVYLTPKGVAVSEAHGERVRAVETEWRSMLGDKSVTTLRQALEEATSTARSCCEDAPIIRRSPVGWGRAAKVTRCRHACAGENDALFPLGLR
jgi:hypothetical protein